MAFEVLKLDISRLVNSVHDSNIEWKNLTLLVSNLLISKEVNDEHPLNISPIS